MTKKVRDSLNKEHSTLLEAFETISKSGFVKVFVTLVIFGSALLWRVEVMSMKITDISSVVKNHNDTLGAHRIGVWHRPVAKDTIYYAMKLPRPEINNVRRSPFGSSMTEEE